MVHEMPILTFQNYHLNENTQLKKADLQTLPQNTSSAPYSVTHCPPPTRSLDTNLRSTTLGNPRPAQTTWSLPPSSPPPLQHSGLLSGSPPHQGISHLRAFTHTLPCLAISSGNSPRGLMPHLRRSPQGPSHQGQLDLCSLPRGTHRANTPSLHPPPDQVLLPGFQNYMGHKVRNLVREGNTQATRHSQGLAPEAIQESDSEAGGRGPPHPFPLASVSGTIGLAKEPWLHGP